MTSCTRSARRILWNFEKVSWVKNWTPNETVGFRLLAETSVAGSTRVGGGRWKIQNRKTVPISLCRRTFKLKGNKKVRTWTEKSLCVFRISRSYVLSFWTFDVRFTHIHIMAMVHLFNRGVQEGATPFPGLLHVTLDPDGITLSAKQSGIKYHFLSLWYDSTWVWTPESRIIDEHSNTKNILAEGKSGYCLTHWYWR